MNARGLLFPGAVSLALWCASQPISAASAATITVNGTVNDPAATVQVNGVQAAVSGNTFQAAGIGLSLGVNTITVIATNTAGTSTQQSRIVYVHSPSAGPTPWVVRKVTGTVNDPQASITVNGFAAMVANGAFTAYLPLGGGLQQVTTVATNAAGDTTTKTVEVCVVHAPVPHP